MSWVLYITKLIARKPLEMNSKLIGHIELGKNIRMKMIRWQQPVLLKFNSWKARNDMYKLRKHTNFHMKTDLTSRKEHVLELCRCRSTKKVVWQSNPLTMYMLMPTVHSSLLHLRADSSNLIHNTSSIYYLIIYILVSGT